MDEIAVDVIVEQLRILGYTCTVKKYSIPERTEVEIHWDEVEKPGTITYVCKPPIKYLEKEFHSFRNQGCSRIVKVYGD